MIASFQEEYNFSVRVTCRCKLVHRLYVESRVWRCGGDTALFAASSRRVACGRRFFKPAHEAALRLVLADSDIRDHAKAELVLPILRTLGLKQGEAVS